MNDNEREEWINNDEGLYDAFKRSGLSMRGYLKTFRKEVDVAVKPVADGTKRVHYLKYGG